MTAHFLQRFADVEVCDIVTTGRRTGQRHEVEIWFGVLDDTMYLIAGNGPTTDWLRNLQADPGVTVKLDHPDGSLRSLGRARPACGVMLAADGGRSALVELRGVARVVTDPDERERVGDLMGAKYVWDGDSSIGLTYAAWCYEVPAVAIEFEVIGPR